MTQLHHRPEPLEHEAQCEPRRRRFTVDEYERMLEVGILQDGDKVEMIDGELYEMATQRSPHMACVDRSSRWFMFQLGDRVLVRGQGPVRLEGSVPEPDIAIVKYRENHYEDRHPNASEIYLAIEVSLTTLTSDRRLKAPMYAREGIRELWIIDLNMRTVWVYRDPAGDEYGSITRHVATDTVTPLAFRDLPVPLSALLG